MNMYASGSPFPPQAVQDRICGSSLVANIAGSFSVSSQLLEKQPAYQTSARTLSHFNFFLNSRAASSVPVVQFLYHLKSIFRSVLCQLHICHPARYSWKNMLQQIFIILLAGFPILFILSRVFTLPEFRIIVICFALGSATTYLLAQWSLKRQPVQGENDGTSRVYCLDHGVLNISVPLQTMWMNMGYWEVGRLYV
jgi:hypothetical protein